MKKLVLVCFVLLASVPFLNAKDNADNLPKVKNLNSITSKIEYPQDALKQSIEGKVIARILVNENGIVEDYSREDFKGQEIFFESVEKVLWSLQFEPAIENDIPVKSWVEIPFSFRLPKKEPMKPKS